MGKSYSRGGGVELHTEQNGSFGLRGFMCCLNMLSMKPVGAQFKYRKNVWEITTVSYNRVGCMLTSFSSFFMIYVLSSGR